MSDFYGCLESTSFRVLDREAFLADAQVQILRRHAQQEGFFDEDSDGYWAFGWHGQYPSTTILYSNPENPGDEIELDICELIQSHILNGDVCQIGISGNEKLCYIGGDIVFITSEGVVHLPGITEWSIRLTRQDLAEFAENFRTDVGQIL